MKHKLFASKFHVQNDASFLDKSHGKRIKRNQSFFLLSVKNTFLANLKSPIGLCYGRILFCN